MSPAGPPLSPSPAPPGKKTVFLRRLTSTLALWGLVVAAIAVGTNPLFYILLGGLGLASCREYAAMDPTVPSPWSWIFLALSLAWTVVTFTITARTGFPWSPIVDLGFIAAITIAAFLPSLFRPLDGRNTLWAIAWTILGFLYIPWSWSFMTRLLFNFGHSADGRLAGVPYVLFVIAVTKMTDSGAYAIGSLIGKHKMIPHISPGKTWEGLLGAALGALIAGFAVYFGFRQALPLLDPTHVAILSLVLAAVCVVGDLAESVLKRCLAIKDSGALLPGIGGALDLIDSLIWTGPVFYFYLLYVCRLP